MNEIQDIWGINNFVDIKLICSSWMIYNQCHVNIIEFTFAPSLPYFSIPLPISTYPPPYLNLLLPTPSSPYLLILCTYPDLLLPTPTLYLLKSPRTPLYFDPTPISTYPRLLCIYPNIHHA